VTGRITESAERLLTQHPDPCPRYCLLRNVLGLPLNDPQCLEAQKAMLESKHVQSLGASQLQDSTWGRFHSQDSKVKVPFRTTEFAIRRALALGLTKSDPILKKACDYMEKFLQGKATWSDWVEKHEGWLPNTRFITAATLAEVDPENPLLEPILKLWMEILQRTFTTGRYDPVAERNAHRDLNGIHTKGKYLHLGMMYPLLILSLASLPENLEVALLRWLWDRDEGMYYATPQKLSEFPSVDSPRFSSWLDGLMVLSRFPRAGQVISPALDWIWQQRNSEGLWAYHPRPGVTPFFPLSEDWRRPYNRVIDCSIYVLLLFSRKGLQ
jgi:hypothetical protein